MTTYTTSLRLIEPTPLDPAVRNSWGPLLNANQVLIESAITDTVVVSINGLTTYTLTTANGAADQARPLVQQYTGALTSDCTVTLPNVPKFGWAQNSTTGGHNVILSAGAGVKATVPPDGNLYWYSADGATNVSFPVIGYGALSAQALSAGSVAATGPISGATLAATFGVTGQSVAVTGPITGASVTATGSVSAQSVTATGPITGNVIVAQSVTSGAIAANGLITAAQGMTISAGGILTITGAQTIGVTAAAALATTGVSTGNTGNVNYSMSCTAAAIAQAFYAISDVRVKTDIETITPSQGADWVQRGRPVTYVMDGAERAGFIAQEDVAAGRGRAVVVVQDDDPRFAEGDGVVPPGHRLIRDYNQDVAYLTAALQHALARIEALEKGR